MKPNSRSTLIEYAKRKLGAPLIEINVEDSQIDNILDDTIQLYQERVYDGVEEIYLKYKITQIDIDRKKTNTPVVNPFGLSFSENLNYLTLPDYIISVSEVIKVGNDIYRDMFGRSPEYFVRDQFNFYNNQTVNMADIYLQRMTIDNIQNILNPDNRIGFNVTTGRLYIYFDIDSMLNKYIIIRCSRAVDPIQFTKLYNSRFVKEYFTILLKIQWAQNLRKFANISLPGGVLYNADTLYNDGISEKKEFLEKMSAEWEEYPIMILG